MHVSALLLMTWATNCSSAVQSLLPLLVTVHILTSEKDLNGNIITSTSMGMISARSGDQSPEPEYSGINLASSCIILTNLPLPFSITKFKMMMIFISPPQNPENHETEIKTLGSIVASAYH